jgi:tetratricopeptide (TPR) repeat protein
MTPDERDAYEAFQRGSELLDAHEFRQATVALERAKRLEPDKGSIREALGRAYLSSRQYESAAEEFAVAVELAPADYYAHYGLARSRERLGDARRAARHYKLARCFGWQPPGAAPAWP